MDIFGKRALAKAIEQRDIARCKLVAIAATATPRMSNTHARLVKMAGGVDIRRDSIRAIGERMRVQVAAMRGDA